MYFRKIYNPLPKTVFSAILLSLFLFKKEAGSVSAPRVPPMGSAPRVLITAVYKAPPVADRKNLPQEGLFLFGLLR